MANTRVIKSLSTLLKIEKHRLETLQVLIARLDDRIAQTENDIITHDKTVENEMLLACEDVETGLHQNPFYTRKKFERVQLVEKRESLKIEREILQEQLMEHFQTAKRYEILKDRKIEEDQTEESHKENLFLDEVAISRFNR